MSTKVAEIMVDTLVQAGAKRCYGIAGDTINHFTDAVRNSSLRWVHVRHEEVGALAAGGEAFMSGELAVCAGACGPGSLHFVNGIFESHRNGAPVLLVASDVSRPEVGLDSIQEVDQQRIYEQASVFCQHISAPSQARRIMALAAQTALAKRGVAVVIVNGDMFAETAADEVAWSVHRSVSRLCPADDELDTLARALDDAGTVTLFAGYGAARAHDEVVALATKLKAPMVHSSRSKEFLEPDNEYNVGMTGILGNRAGMDAVLGADITLCLGTDFAWTQFYPGPQQVIQVDSDPTHLGRRAPIRLGLVGDVATTIEALLPRLQEKTDNDHLDKARKQWQDDRDSWQSHAEDKSNELIHPQHVTQMLDRLADEDAFFTSDAGSPMAWLLRHLTANGKRRFLTTLLHGTMANAYPQAMGMAAAWPDRQVIALCGDGGLTMLLGDILTLVQEQLAVKILVYNNSALAYVEMEQRVEGLVDSYTDLKDPDFVKLADACGIPAWHVETGDQLESNMQKWLQTDGPAMLDVKVNREELVMPPKIQPTYVTSTALFGIKAVLDGRPGEVTSLLRDNFLR